MAGEQRVITEDGEEVVVGTSEEVRPAMDEIARLTGGSSGGGRMSYLFGLWDAARAEEAWRGPGMPRLAMDAAYALETLGDQLSDETKAFLRGLARFAQ
jgi:hypothetical protein